jgi:hypothetical protein
MDQIAVAKHRIETDRRVSNTSPALVATEIKSVKSQALKPAEQEKSSSKQIHEHLSAVKKWSST